MITESSDKKVYDLNIRDIVNGYICSYLQGGRSLTRCFYSWKELLIWLSEQNQHISDDQPNKLVNMFEEHLANINKQDV